MPFDDNFQRLARMQNIFGPTNPVGGGMQPSQFPLLNPMQQQPDPLEQYQPDTRASDMLFQMINQMPARNRPGIGRKILASLVGLGSGPQAADQAMYQPYYQQMQDWQAKLGPVEKLAGEERLQNANMRQLAALLLRDKQAQRELDIKQQTADIAAKRADAYVALQQYKMQNPDWEIEKQLGGNYWLINPKTGERKDTGLNTGTLDSLQELNLKIKGQKEVAAIPRTVYGMSTTSTVTPPEAEQPTQQKQRMINNANKLINEHPEFREVIEFDPDNGLPRVKPEGTYIQGGPISGFFGGKTRRLTADDIKTINKAIEEGKPPEAAKVSTTQRTTTSVKGAVPTASTTVKRTGTTRVKAPDGRTGTWDFSQGDIPAGYTEIK